MLNISKEVMIGIEWGVVPLILLGILTYFLLYKPDKNLSAKIINSCSSGKFAGLLIFILFVLSQKNRDLIFSLNMPAYEFNLIFVLISISIGGIFSWVFALIHNRIFIGLYILISISLTCISIYCYLFIQNFRSHLVFITMGTMLGVLIYTSFFPKDFLPEQKKPGS